jgi:sec-independent protein translocase protein TatA
MGLSAQHILLLLVIALLLFGRGKISELMGDVAQGIKSFKKGISEDEEEAPARPAPKAIEHKRASPQRAKTVSRAKTSSAKSARSRKTS